MSYSETYKAKLGEYIDHGKRVSRPYANKYSTHLNEKPLFVTLLTVFAVLSALPVTLFALFSVGVLATASLLAFIGISVLIGFGGTLLFFVLFATALVSLFVTFWVVIFYGFYSFTQTAVNSGSLSEAASQFTNQFHDYLKPILPHEDRLAAYKEQILTDPVEKSE